MWETSCDLRRRPGLGPLRRGPGLSAFVATEGSGQEAGTRARGCPGLSGWGAALPASPPSTCCPAGRGAPAWGQESWASPCHCAWLGLRAPPTPLPAVTGGRTVKRDSLGRSVTCWEMDVWGAGGAPRSYPPWGESRPGELTEKTHRSPQPVPSLCATCDLCKPAVCWVPGAPDVGVASTPSRPGPQRPSWGIPSAGAGLELPGAQRAAGRPMRLPRVRVGLLALPGSQLGRGHMLGVGWHL